MLSGFLPIWNTDNLSKATRNSSITEEEKLKIPSLSEGIAVSPCKLPCTSTKATVQVSMKAEFNQPGLMGAEILRPPS